MYVNDDILNNDISKMLLVFPNKNELRIAEDILKRQHLDIEIFQTPEEFSGIILYAIQYPSELMEKIYNALRGHNIITWGSYTYDSSKLQRINKGPNLLTNCTTTSRIFPIN